MSDFIGEYLTHISFVAILIIGCLVTIFYMFFRSIKRRAR